MTVVREEWLLLCPLNTKNLEVVILRVLVRTVKLKGRDLEKHGVFVKKRSNGTKVMVNVYSYKRRDVTTPRSLVSRRTEV